jgi:ABC-2 type transport system permease protein
MTRLIAAELRKLFTARLWLWLLPVSAAWTAGYAASAIALDNRPGGLTPPLSGAAGQHALFAICAGGAGPLAAILAAAGTAGEFRHRTAAATFLATPRPGHHRQADHLPAGRRSHRRPQGYHLTPVTR